MSDYDFDYDVGSTSNNKKYKYKYIMINNNTFDIQKVKCIPDEKYDYIYNIRYNDEFTKFYIIPDKSFDSYGIKNKYSPKQKILYNDDENNNELQFSIIFDNKNKYHNIFKDIINKIYNKLDINFKNHNIKVYNPISTNHNTMNIDINENTIIYKFENQQLSLMKLNELIYHNHIRFKIQPYLFINSLKENNKTLYINIVAKTVIVEFKKHYISYDHCCFAFSNDPSDNDSIQSDISQDPNKKGSDKSNRVRF
jgi:hypothetical protein